MLEDVLTGDFSFAYVALHGKSQDIDVVVGWTVLKEVFTWDFLIAYFALHMEPQYCRECGIRWALLVTCTFRT